MKTCDKEFNASIVSDKTYTSIKYLGMMQQSREGFAVARCSRKNDIYCVNMKSIFRVSDSSFTTCGNI